MYIKLARHIPLLVIYYLKMLFYHYTITSASLNVTAYLINRNVHLSSIKYRCFSLTVSEAFPKS